MSSQTTTREPSSVAVRRGVTRVLSVAPMMDRTDRHFRYLLRQITRRALLYTEMVTTGAVIHGDRERLLGFDALEHPIALQLGGDDPAALAECARIGEQRGYDEVNINVGCPSDRVQQGNFGVCLMGQPERVARCVEAMRAAVAIPVTVKHRIGFDALDRYEDMARFVRIVAEAGCDRFTVHARKAWLQGLSPKENRDVPPLRYDEVRRLKAARPELVIELNGGVRTLDEAAAQLAAGVDAVMIGRGAYDDPFALARADTRLLGAAEDPAPDRHAVVEAMLPYIEARVAAGEGLPRIARHMLNLFRGRPGARAWRRSLTEGGHREGAGVALVREALGRVPRQPAPRRAPDAPQPSA